MNNEDKKLFQMGEVTKALGLTRRILINYEEHGLLTPAVKSKNRSFRYYSVDNMVHIRMIRSLQNIGLSLAEIRDYIDNTGNLDEKIHHLLLLRSQLDQYIAHHILNDAVRLHVAEVGNLAEDVLVLDAEGCAGCPGGAGHGQKRKKLSAKR